MKTVFHNINYKSSDIFNLYPLYDLHVGHIGCNEALIKAYVSHIAADPMGLVVLGGDLIDGISQADRRYDPAQLAPWCRDELGDPVNIIESQIIQAGKLLAPIADKVIGMLLGNHERTPIKRLSIPVFKRLALTTASYRQDDINPYDPKAPAPDFALGYHGYIGLTFQRPHHSSRVLIYAHHGYGGGRTPGGKLNKLSNMLADWPDADIVLAGHVHDLLDLPVDRKVPDWPHARRDGAGSTKKYPRVAAFCGTFLSGDAPETPTGWPRTSYAVEKGYPERPIGGLKIRIKPETRHLEVVKPVLELRG